MRWSLVLASATLAGCVQTSALPLTNDTVQILGHAAPVCGAAGAQNVAFARAAVETLRGGFDKFVIVEAAAQNNVRIIGRTPMTAQTYGTATVFDGGGMATGFGQSTTYYSGGQPIVGGTHDQGLVVHMFKAGEAGAANAIDARRVLGRDWRQVVQDGVGSTCG